MGNLNTGRLMGVLGTYNGFDVIFMFENAAMGLGES